MTVATYKFDNFNYCDSVIIIPKNSVFYRGISDIKNPNILRKNTPIFLSSKKVAFIKYANSKNENLYCISNKTPLRLLDLRKIINLLPMLIDSYKFDPTDSEYLEAIKVLSVSLGIVDLNIQVKLLHDILKANDVKDVNIINGFKRLHSFLDYMNKFRGPRGPYNKLGVRIGITDIDGYMVLILKELFKNYCDGFISPLLTSPIQDDLVLHEEILIFDTENLEVVPEHDIREHDIDLLIKQYNVLLNFNYKNKLNFNGYFHKGGGISFVQDRNAFFQDKVKVKKALKIANNFSNKFITSPKQNDTLNHDYYYDKFAKEQGIFIPEAKAISRSSKLNLNI
jgi:hypothetical protein